MKNLDKRILTIMETLIPSSHAVIAALEALNRERNSNKVNNLLDGIESLIRMRMYTTAAKHLVDSGRRPINKAIAHLLRTPKSTVERLSQITPKEAVKRAKKTAKRKGTKKKPKKKKE